jgi:hypothetical protein
MKSLITFFFLLTGIGTAAQQIVPLNHIHEVTFEGSIYKATDNPVRDIELVAVWKHDEEGEIIRIHGYFDGNGQGSASGNIFKVRFCPTRTGLWTLTDVESNDPVLAGQSEGLSIRCETSGYPGFWITDPESADQRWYKRSDGSHPYIFGNTMYTFLSEHFRGKPTGGNIAGDVRENSKYFKKIRFGITGDIYPHPTEKPFLDHQGNPTDDGSFSHRPNPKWFGERVYLAVEKAFANDLIADIILNGPDSENSRSVLKASENNGSYAPFLRYMAARYGSYPNVWFCLSNEYNIRTPRYVPEYIMEVGKELNRFLAYPVPVSVHANQGNWDDRLNADGKWYDHIIIQNKIKRLFTAADYNILNYWIGGKKPVINDELAYEGEGDGWEEEDVIEAHLGAFAGGGYGSTGHKPAGKVGHYFSGNFDASEHHSADNLQWMREIITENITFWKMSPVFYTQVTYRDQYDGSRSSIFFNIHPESRVLEWKNNEYVLASNQAYGPVVAHLPDGEWLITLYDCSSMEKKVLAESATGEFSFNLPESRAVMVHVKKEK